MRVEKNSIYANTGQLDKMASLLKGYPSSASKVMNRVLSRTVDTVRVEVARQIPKVFGAPQKEIRHALNSGKRKVKTLVGASGEGSVSIEVLGRPLSAVRFRHTPTRAPMSGKRGKPRRYRPTVTIYRERGAKSLGPVKVGGEKKSIFLAPTGARKANGISHIFFYRTGEKNSKGREELKSVITLSIPQMVVNEKVADPLIQAVNQTVAKRLEHELNLEFVNLGSNLRKVGD